MVPHSLISGRCGMKGPFVSLRRLRWKLTFSYTLVTTLAYVLTWLALVGGIVALIKYADRAFPPMVLRGMTESYAPRLEPALARTPPDAKGLEEELQAITNESEGREPDYDPEKSEDKLSKVLDLLFGEPERFVFVVDEERRVLAVSRGGDKLPSGERLDAERLLGLDPILTAALNGEQDPDRLLSRPSDNEQGRIALVAPVRDDDGRVLGAMVDTFNTARLTVFFFGVVGVGALVLTIPAAFLGTIFGFLTARGLTKRLRKLADAAQSWRRGDFSAVSKDQSKDEIGQLSRGLNEMAAQLESLIQARGELATLEARNRFARDLHDSVKQQVYATSLQVDTARALMDPEAKADAHLIKAKNLLQGAQKELNVLIHEMRPAALEGKGLAGALRDYAADWSRGSEIPAVIRVRGEREVPLEAEQALFRVAQEALANVARHSTAKKVEIDLDYDAESLTLCVADDGRGFDPAALNKGFGLRNMRERLTRLGGRAEVHSAPKKGTRITCVCPTGCPEENGTGEA